MPIFQIANSFFFGQTILAGNNFLLAGEYTRVMSIACVGPIMVCCTFISPQIFFLPCLFLCYQTCYLGHLNMFTSLTFINCSWTVLQNSSLENKISIFDCLAPLAYTFLEVTMDFRPCGTLLFGGHFNVWCNWFPILTQATSSQAPISVHSLLTKKYI